MCLTSSKRSSGLLASIIRCLLTDVNRIEQCLQRAKLRRKALSSPFSTPCLSIKEPAGSYIGVRSRKLKKLHGGITFLYLKCEHLSFILINFNIYFTRRWCLDRGSKREGSNLYV